MSALLASTATKESSVGLTFSTRSVEDSVRALQHTLYRAAKADPGDGPFVSTLVETGGG